MDNRYDNLTPDERLDAAAEAGAVEGQAEFSAQQARAAKEQTEYTNKVSQQAEARADQYATGTKAANLSAQNDMNDATMGKDWPGRTGAKWDEAKETVKAKAQDVVNDGRARVNNVTGADDVATNQYTAANNPYGTANAATANAQQDETFGEKVEDFTDKAGDKLHEGVDKVKGWFGKDDEPRVQ